ncbi:MAG: flagellar basal body rod protein FlgB [Steroidobacteraceae bacterium]
MRFDLDAYLGVHPQALALGAKRTELIANNLANADTPGFKARDIDFRAALAAAGDPGASLPVQRTAAGHLSAGGADGAGGIGADAGAALRYRTPLAPSLDGNTVEPQLEQAAFAENAVRYQATLTFLNARFRSLMTAITGQ